MNTAFVYLWKERAGAVSWDEATGVASFEYDPKFARNNWDIAPIEMPVARLNTIFSFPGLAHTDTFKGLPGLLADVLPDKYGHTLINTWLARNGRAPDSMHPVEMLCFAGNRGMGALEFEPATPKSNNAATVIEIDGLLEIAKTILDNRREFKSNMTAGEEKALADILKIGTSAGGARAKALIAYNELTGEVRSGQADAPNGFTHWLIKFDGVHDSQFGETYGYGRVEMAYHLMAVDCQVEMMECRLFEENERAHFMTRRFDRLPGKEKVHVQTWCALSHVDFRQVSAYSYEQLFQTMRILGLSYPRAEQLYRRMVFNLLARNCDDHTKNFAFTLEKGGAWDLSPAYDVCHAYRPGSPWVSRQSLSINGKRENITKADLLNVAVQMNIRKANDIIDEISGVISNWRSYAAKAGVEPGLMEAIGKTLLVPVR